MFSFNKPLENLIGAAYLSGSLEGLKKSKEVSPTEVETYFEEAKHVRRVLLNRAESDGYREPVHHIEEAKKIAKEVLNTTTKKQNLFSSETLLNKSEPSANITKKENIFFSETSPNKNKGLFSNTKPSLEESHELMPIKNTPFINNKKKENIPPSVLQLGGKRRKSRKQRKSRSRK
jgi:hypothetical protein